MAKRSGAFKGRGGSRAPGENREPVRSNNRNFTKTAKRVHPSNHYAPMRGGIRF